MPNNTICMISDCLIIIYLYKQYISTQFTIVHRKTRCGMKSKNAPDMMDNIFTYIATWKERKFDHLAKVAECL